MRHPGAIQRADGVIDSGLPLIQGVRRGRGAARHPVWAIAVASAGGVLKVGWPAGGQGRRRLDMAQRQVGTLDVGLDLRWTWERGRSGGPRPEQRRSNLADGSAGAARLDHQLDAGGSCGGAARARRGGAGQDGLRRRPAPGRRARARRDGQRERAGNDDRAPPPTCARAVAP